MAKEQSKWAIGIGAQTDQATVNTDVSTATALQTTVADGSGATGILLRDDEDISLSMARLSDDLGMISGSLSRLGSSFRSTEPTCSFSIDMMGNRFTPATPGTNEFDLDEYMLRIFEGARLTEGTSAPANTTYQLAALQEYQTLKIWRSTESWTLVGCTFDLSWAFVAGEKCVLTVTVFADSVIHDDTEVFPATDAATAYGNQLGAPPIFQLAGAKLDSITRGMQSATLTVSYAQEQIGDSNVSTGIINSQGQRTVAMTADWYVESTADDFANLEADLPALGTSPLRELEFALGQAAGAGDTINAFSFKLHNFEFEVLGEVNSGDNAVRTIAGHAVVAGATGTGSGPDTEFRIFTI